MTVPLEDDEDDPTLTSAVNLYAGQGVRSDHKPT